jgi:hypothetical protein
MEMKRYGCMDLSANISYCLDDVMCLGMPWKIEDLFPTFLSSGENIFKGISEMTRTP